MAIVDKKGVLHGPVDNILYRSYRGMQIAQMKAAKVKQTIASREASLEFGLAATTAASIRAVFNRVYKGNDGGMANRLTAVTLKSIKTAGHKRRGERDIHDGDPSMFSGFQFNKNSALEDCLRVKPQVELNETGKVSVQIPAFTEKDLRGPEADHFVVRFLAVSFNFKTSIASYLSSKEIKIERGESFEGVEIEVLDALPAGRLVLLGMFIHAYKWDHFDGYTCVNNKTWSPGGIIGGWHAPALEEPAVQTKAQKEIAVVGDVPMYPLPYMGAEIRNKFRDLWAKQGKRTEVKLKQRPVIPDMGGDLPTGDFSI